MKKTILLSLMISCSVLAFSQWTKKTNISGAGKNHPVTFSIGDKGFAFTGFDGSFIYSDGYEYNPETDSWRQLSNFPGGARGFSIGASYNGKGYIGFGLGVDTLYSDLWEYTPGSDSWKQLAECPCFGRRHPVLTITSDGKLYAGLGDGEDANGNFVGFDDWWEYDVATDVWTQQTDLPGTGRHHPYFFTLDSIVYAGFGHNGNVIYKDFYKYNSNTGIWTTLKDFPGESRVAGSQFAYKGFGYIVDGEGSDHQNLNDGEFYKYDPSNDSWEELASHSGDGLWAPGAFVVDSMVYVVGGDLDNNTSLRTLWAYALDETRVDSALTNDRGDISLSSDFYDDDATFQWVDCGNGFSRILGERDISIIIPEGKAYALIVTYSEGGKDTSACYTNDPVSLEENLFQDNYAVSIFPNPIKNRLNIERQSNVNEQLEYTIVNAYGVEVEQGDFIGQDYSIDLSALASGMYYVILRSADRSTEKAFRIQKID